MANSLEDLLMQQTNTGGLDRLAQMYLMTMGQQQQRQPRTVNIGGQNILDVTPRNGLNSINETLMPALTQLAQGYMLNQQMDKKGQFMKGVQQITQSTKTPDEKINYLVSLTAQHGQDYGLGVKEIVQQYGQMANRNKPASDNAASITTPDEIQKTAEGISTGAIPPNPQNVSFRDRTRVNAALQEKGFNLSRATSEWNATQKFLSSMNSEKQVRLRQAITSVREALDGLSQMNDELKRSGSAPLNAAQLSIMANTGNPMATKYLGQINIIRDELAQVFMGGNSPTDKALDLAKETLNKNWSAAQLKSAIDNINQNLQYRENAINYATTYGTNAEGGTRYSPAKATPENKVTPPSGQRVKVRSANGQIGSIPVEQLQDALRQGYMQVK